MENIENTESVQDEKNNGTNKRFSRKQWILLVFFGLTNLVSSMTTSLQAPFYPQEAEKKGATATEYGLVFGVFEFVIFVAAPIYGQFINKIGPKTLFCSSLIVNGVMVILFGLLDKVDDHTWFISLSFVCRILEAFSLAGSITSSFVFIACEFPSVATTFASLETFVGVGAMIGPTVGGALYTLGGFPLPFHVLGAVLLVVGFGSLLILPSVETAKGKDGKDQEGIGIISMLKIPEVALAAITIVSTAAAQVFVIALLEPHIRQFGLTPVQVGLVIIVSGALYALSAPPVGYVCDKIKKPAYVTVVGNFVICASFLLIGPVSFMPLETNLWVCIAGLAIQGFGFGCCYVSTFVVGLKGAIENGLPDNVATYGALSGMWQSMISLGAWIGPSAGGALYDTVGFRQGSLMPLVFSFVAGASILLHIWYKSFAMSSMIEAKPLLDNISESSEEHRSIRKKSGTFYGAI